MDKGGRCEKEAGGEGRGNHVGLHGNFPDDKKQQKYLIEARFFFSCRIWEKLARSHESSSLVINARLLRRAPPPPRHRDGRTREEAMRSEE